MQALKLDRLGSLAFTALVIALTAIMITLAVITSGESNTYNPNDDDMMDIIIQQTIMSTLQ